MKILPAVLILLAVPLVGQTIQLTDDSPSDSPLTFKGTMTFIPNANDEFSIPCSVTGHNHSNKAVVAYVTDINVLKPSGEPQEMPLTKDLFFYADEPVVAYEAPKPGMDFDLRLNCEYAFGADIWGSDHAPFRVPKSAEAHIKTVFAQFADGSTWGDETEIMSQRNDALNFLKALKLAQSEGGDSAFAQTLQAHGPHEPKPALWKQRHEILKLPDIKAQTAELDKKLAAAQAHAAWLKQ